MEILKSDMRWITLDRYSIERETPDQPVKVRAWLSVSAPGQPPETIRVRVDYEHSDIPSPNERDLGRRLVSLLGNRFS
jgi:hypothetical protein